MFMLDGPKDWDTNTWVTLDNALTKWGIESVYGRQLGTKGSTKLRASWYKLQPEEKDFSEGTILHTKYLQETEQASTLAMNTRTFPTLR